MQAKTEGFFVEGRGLEKLSDRVLPTHVVRIWSGVRGWYMSREEIECAIFEDAVEETD